MSSHGNRLYNQHIAKQFAMCWLKNYNKGSIGKKGGTHMDKTRVAVVFGGQSSEHEVSRVSAEEIIRSMDKDKYDIIMIGVTRRGRWLRYDGPVNYLSDGRWQKIA